MTLRLALSGGLPLSGWLPPEVGVPLVIGRRSQRRSRRSRPSWISVGCTLGPTEALNGCAQPCFSKPERLFDQHFLSRRQVMRDGSALKAQPRRFPGSKERRFNGLTGKPEAVGATDNKI